MSTPDWVARFRRVAAELQAHPQVCVTRCYIAPPATEAELQEVERDLGQRLPPELRALYRQANGLALRWFPTDTPEYDPDAPTVEAPFQWVPEGGSHGGAINIGPVGDLRQDHADEFWFEDMEDGPIDFHHGGFDQPHDWLPFHQGLRAVDYFDSFRVVALALTDTPRLRVVFGDDHGADFVSFPPVPFGDYLDAVLSTWGSYRQRVLRFFSDEVPSALPQPTLDEVLQECRMDEMDWIESLEALYGEE